MLWKAYECVCISEGDLIPIKGHSAKISRTTCVYEPEKYEICVKSFLFGSDLFFSL